MELAHEIAALSAQLDRAETTLDECDEILARIDAKYAILVDDEESDLWAMEQACTECGEYHPEKYEDNPGACYHNCGCDDWECYTCDYHFKKAMSRS